MRDLFTVIRHEDNEGIKSICLVERENLLQHLIVMKNLLELQIEFTKKDMMERITITQNGSTKP